MKHGTVCLGVAGLTVFSFGLFTHFFIAYDYYYFVAAHLALGLALLFFFLLKGGLGWVRTTAARRAAGFGLGSILYSLLFLFLLVVINLLVLRFDPLYFDSTEQKVFTLATQTRKVLASLKEPVLIRAFYVAGEVDPNVKSLLERIVRGEELIRWELVDAEKRPDLVKKYGITEPGTLHFSFEQGSSKREAKVLRNIDEQEVVNALLKLTRGGETVVYYITGHGQSELDDPQSQTALFFMKEAIEGEAISLKPLNLGSVPEVPQDADALMLSAPKKRLLPREMELFMSYLQGGGNAIMLHEPQTSESIRELAEPLGIIVGRDVILDGLEMGQIGVQPVVTDYSQHVITADFKEATIFPIVCSVRRSEQYPEGAVLSELARTSKNSWAETDLERIFSEQPEASFDSEDIAGPVPLAVAFEGVVPRPSSVEGTNASPDTSSKEAEKLSRVVVVGDADFVTNVNIRQLYNRDFFLNSLNWVIGADEVISLRERTFRKSLQGLSEDQLRPLYLLTAVLIPELVVLSGFLVWWRRKRSS